MLVFALTGFAVGSALASRPSAPAEAGREGGVTSPVAADAAQEARPPIIAESFDALTAGSLPERWFVPTAGWKAGTVVDQTTDARWLELVHEENAGATFGNLMTCMDATPLRGLRVELRARMRTVGDGHGQMWLRVDRPSGRPMGAFDNMGDRPVQPGPWQEVRIEAEIASDAEGLCLGWISIAGKATIQIDDVRLVALGDARLQGLQPATPPVALSDHALRNLEAATRLFGYLRFFHPSDQVVGVTEWDLVALELVEAVESASDDAELAARLSTFVAPLAPTMQIWAGSVEAAPPLPAPPAGAGRVRSMVHHGVGGLDGPIATNVYHSSVADHVLGDPLADKRFAASLLVKELIDGVACRLPFEVFADDVGTLPHGETPARFTSAAPRIELFATNRATRLAGVVLAWTAFQHFYPYFDVVECDWDAALVDALRSASEAGDEREYLRTLKTLVARLHDGHGGAYNSVLAPWWTLPIRLTSVPGSIDGSAVFAGSLALGDGATGAVPESMAPGDAVIAIDGQPIEAALAEAGRSISAATERWRQLGALAEVVRRFDDAPVLLRLRRLDGSEYEAQLVPVIVGAVRWPQPTTTPPDGSEIAEGIVYFSLKGTDAAAFEEALPALTAARGIIFDLRGYPADAAMRVLEHLISGPATSAQWCVPVVTRPDREALEWTISGRWNLQPRAPHFDVPVAFLTDASAISYAESVMGIVEHYKLGEIVGSTTAGTNGNINPFHLPGDYLVVWTGMQVLKHDGSRHHGVGIPPTVPVEPTRQGIAEGRDEVLEKGIEVVQRAIAERAVARDGAAGAAEDQAPGS